MNAVVQYLAQGLDINKKSDIFWFPESGLNPQDVIIYSFVRPAKFTIAGKRYIERAGIKMVHLLSKDLRWVNDLSELSAKYFELLIKETLRNIGLYIKLLLKKSQGGRALFNWQLNNISWLLDKSLQYVAFFKAKNIKVHFGFLAEDDPIMSAVERGMEENKGVLVYAHWSNPPLVEIWPSVDTFFVWGPYYKQFYEAIGYQLKNVVYSGYIFDSLFSKIEKESEEYRRKLSENGVKFTLAFFDNAYIEDGGWFSKESMRDFQSRLLSLVKSNPDWGIILKPKRKKTFDDITDQDILSMLNEIEKEGRCLILDHDVLPVTVGKAADLVIGLGSFSSPAVEVALCQKPVLFYDPSKQSSHPFHKEGLDKIVFEDIDKLCDKLKSFSQDQNREDYQSLDFVIEDIDPYRDGRSYQRVGSYIRNILRGFQSEKTKQGALDEANQQFMNEFGIDKVIRIEEQKNSKFILNTGKI